MVVGNVTDILPEMLHTVRTLSNSEAIFIPNSQLHLLRRKEVFSRRYTPAWTVKLPVHIT